MTEHKPQDTAPRRLNPWNPLDHLRLLWWVLVIPQRLVAYREAYGENAERSVGKWLASTLAWLPLFVPTLALSTGVSSLKWAISPDVYLWAIAGLALAWLIVGLFGRRARAGAGVGMGLVTSVVLVTALIIIPGDVPCLVGAVTDGIAVMVLIVGFIVMGVMVSSVTTFIERDVEKHLKTGSPSWLARGAIVVFVLCQLFLIWFGFLGGWQVFE